MWVRGKKKTYYAFEKKVIIDKVGEVKLVVSRTDGISRLLIEKQIKN